MRTLLLLASALTACTDEKPACDSASPAGSAESGTSDGDNDADTDSDTHTDSGDSTLDDPCAWVDETVDDRDFADYPPVVVCTNPRVGAIDVPASQSEIRVTFSKDMRDGSWSWVQADEATFPEVSGDAYYATTRTNVLPVALEAGHVYQVWVNYGRYDSFADSDGQSAVSYQLTFKTAAG
jgi:hypothetical protein